MAKKKTGRVSPAIPSKNLGNTYDDLSDGDCFLWNGHLMMKCNVNEQEAFDLDTGNYQEDMCDQGVIVPVDIQITWKKK